MPRLTQVLRHLEFGNFRRDIRHVVYHQVSPYELRAFPKGYITEGFPNVLRRFRERMFKIFPPFVFFLVLRDWANKENEKIHRKNPKDFENDV